MSDVTVEILKSIRDELRGFRADVDRRFEQVDRRFEQVDRRLAAADVRTSSMEQRITDTEVRVATEIVAVVGAIHELRDVIVADRAMREQVRDHEARLTRLEARTGSTG